MSRARCERVDNRNVIVFDFETSSAKKSSCEIVQVAAVALNPATMKPYPGAEFNSLMRPLDWDSFDDETIAIHKKTREELAKAPLPEEVWTRFATWARQFTLGSQANRYTLPVPAGHNILKFDLPIVHRYALRYGPTVEDDDGPEQGIFNRIVSHDTLCYCHYWFEDNPELDKFRLDTLRRYFGMPQKSIENAHDALQDVRDTAAILEKFMMLSRRSRKNIVFKDCFNPEKVDEELKRRREKKRAGN